MSMRVLRFKQEADTLTLVLVKSVVGQMTSLTYIVDEHQLVALSSRIAGDACKFGDQVRHDHQQHKPDKTVHGCDNYLQE